METLHLPILAALDPFMIPIVGIICGTVIAITAIILGKKSEKDREGDKTETETIQQIYAQCNRLADRIEALETIILEQERKNKR